MLPSGIRQAQVPPCDEARQTDSPRNYSDYFAGDPLWAGELTRKWRRDQWRALGPCGGGPGPGHPLAPLPCIRISEEENAGFGKPKRGLLRTAELVGYHAERRVLCTGR